MGFDLFCGSGGTTQGLVEACEAHGARLNLVAVNHWQTAIDSHTLNHPTVRHYCEPVDSLRPKDAVPSGKLDILAAAEESC